MTLSNQQQTRIKQLLIDNPEISVEEIRAKLGSDGAALSMDFIAELRADALHCRRLLEQEGLMSPAKKSPARAGSAERESERREGSREATGANGQPIVRPLTNSQQGGIHLVERLRFFWRVVRTVVGLTPSTRAVSRIPLPLSAISTICFLTSGCRPLSS